MSTEEPTEKNYSSKDSNIATIFSIPDYEGIQVKRAELLWTGAKIGTTLGALGVLFNPNVTFTELVKGRKFMYLGHVLKGTMTGFISGGIYSYTSSAVSKARGNADDGWNHVVAGMATAVPYGIAYNKTILGTLYGGFVFGALMGLFKLGAKTQGFQTVYIKDRPCPTQQTRYSEVFMRNEAVKKEKELSSL